MTKDIIYEIGCGDKKIIANSIGVDFIGFEGVSIVCDLNKHPWPIESNSGDRVMAYHVLEHLDNTVESVKEIYRILKPGGIVEIRVPHYSCSSAWTDPTHKHAFGVGSFFYFDPKHPFYNFYGNIENWPKFNIIKRSLNYNHYQIRPRFFISRLVILVFNSVANFMPYPFERNLIYLVGGFEEIYFMLKKVK